MVNCLLRLNEYGYKTPDDIPKIAYGECYGRDGFEDGISISTSELMEVNFDEGYIKTKNTKYDLGIISPIYYAHCYIRNDKQLPQLMKYRSAEDIETRE